jgi:hypothetical protein
MPVLPQQHGISRIEDNMVGPLPYEFSNALADMYRPEVKVDLSHGVEVDFQLQQMISRVATARLVVEPSQMTMAQQLVTQATSLEELVLDMKRGAPRVGIRFVFSFRDGPPKSIRGIKRLTTLRYDWTNHNNYMDIWDFSELQQLKMVLVWWNWLGFMEYHRSQNYETLPELRDLCVHFFHVRPCETVSFPGLSQFVGGLKELARLDLNFFDPGDWPALDISNRFAT